MNRNEKILFKNENGQALIEFFLFLPFMLMTYSIIMNVSNAINASLNQQKVTRAYFYYRMQNNSMMPKPRRGRGEIYDKFNVFGMQIVGWTTELYGGLEPVAPCFKFKIPLAGKESDKCLDPYTEQTTQLIRVGTVYGVCGATFVKTDHGYVRAPSDGVGGIATINIDSCLLR